jgi:hypothetical protein
MFVGNCFAEWFGCSPQSSTFAVRRTNDLLYVSAPPNASGVLRNDFFKDDKIVIGTDLVLQLVQTCNHFVTERSPPGSRAVCAGVSNPKEERKVLLASGSSTTGARLKWSIQKWVGTWTISRNTTGRTTDA